MAPVSAIIGSRSHHGGVSRRSITEALLFHVLVDVGTVGEMAFSIVNVNAIKLLIFFAVISGVIAAPLLIVVLIVSNNRSIMSDYVNGRVAKVLGWLTSAGRAVASRALFTTGGISFS